MANKLVRWIAFEEGFRSRPYRDTVGVLSVGYGRNLVAHPLPGRNWSANPCTEYEAEGWLVEELGEMYASLRQRKPVIDTLGPVRSAALLNMTYQLGVGGVLKFKKMWAEVEANDWLRASRAARDSRWARQTPNRARRVCKALETGVWPVEVLQEVVK